MEVKAIPDGFRSVQPFLIVQDLEAEMQFLIQGLDAKPGDIITDADGKPRYAELSLGDCKIMMSRPQPGGEGMPAMLYIYVTDCDTHHQRAVKAGGIEMMPVDTQPYGDRHGLVHSPNGIGYCIATHVEDVSPEETARRMAERGI